MGETSPPTSAATPVTRPIAPASPLLPDQALDEQRQERTGDLAGKEREAEYQEKAADGRIG